MEFALRMLFKTAVIPIVVAIVVTWLTIRNGRLRNRAVTIGAVCGFFAGWFTQEFAVWIPQRYLDWIPTAALLLATLPKIAPLPSAWLLVPSFASLHLPRPWAIGIVTAITCAGGLLLERAATKIHQRLFVGVLMATGTVCSVVLVQSFSMKFAQIAGFLTAAFTPGLLWASKPEGNVKGLAMLFYGLMSNLMFIGYANTSSDVPAWCFALPVLAPAILIWNPTSGVKLKTCVAAIAALLLLSVVPALLAHPPWEADV